MQVLLVDYGTEIMKGAKDVCYLDRNFFSLPAQAIECSLACLSPSGEVGSFFFAQKSPFCIFSF